MADYEVTDELTGRTYILTGDSPPTEAELESIFGEQREQQSPEQFTDMPSLEDDTPQTGYQQTIDSLLSQSRGSPIDEAIGEFAAGTAKDLVGAGEVALTMATGGATSIATGFGAAAWLGLAEYGIGGKTLESVNASMEELNKMGTYVPRSTSGQDILEGLAVPMMAIDETADWIATYFAENNPTAQTIIKTTILGSMELFSPARSVTTLTKAKLTLKRNYKAVKETAESLGININIREMRAGVVDAFKDIIPARRAENMPIVQQAMRDAEAAAKGRKDAAYAAAEATDTWIETRAVRDLANDLETRLFEQGFDLAGKKMRVVRDTLNDLRGSDLGPKGGFGGESLAVKYGQLELVLKRINERYGNHRPANKANKIIRNEINRFVDNEFNKVAIEGQHSAISGEAAGVTAWNKAKALNREWRKNFSEDKVIKQLIELEVTPTQFREWLMGASAMNARKEAASTIGRMREILGDNHPAIAGIRQDFLFEVAMPLLERGNPNFNKFLDNYDTMIRKNPDLVKELGLDTSNFAELVTFAEAASKLPAVAGKFHVTDFTKGLAVFWQGSGLAQKALRVGYARQFFNTILDTDRVSQRQILYELAGLKYGEPLMPKKGPVAAQFIAGAAITTIANTQEQ